jgi:predicted Rossmann fold flavoprotein
MFDVVVIGGGAAGLFCAIEAGKRGRRVLVIEHNDRVGKKIAISGGGRCNFTNLHTTSENFLSANPHFCKSALARYQPADFIALIEKYDIDYHEKKLGQLFCDGSSQQIITMLLQECAAANVEIRCNCTVEKIEKTDGFNVETNFGTIQTTSLVIATGGVSIAPLGATDFGYRVARQFGLEIESPRPGLVPFTLRPEVQDEFVKLSGVAVPAEVSCGRNSFRENLLITHRGLSGPAILQISSYWKPGDAVSINWLPDVEVLGLLKDNKESKIELVNLLAKYLPKRFAQTWCKLFAPSKPLQQYSDREITRIATQLRDLQIVPSGTEGFKKAEVTAGGVSTAELSSQTMESTRVPGLFFIGEVVDVTGHLGGFNFQWAWSSAFAAAQAV